MPRLPESQGDASAFARYTRDRWRALDPLYVWWTRHRWSRVIDFLSGNHWRVLEIVDNNLDDARIPKWKRYPIIGLTLAIYNDQMAEFLASQVRFSAVSRGSDPSDIAKAEMAGSILTYLWDLTELETERIDLAAWLLSTGIGSVGVHWDANTGNMLPLAIPEMTQDEDGRQVPTGELIPVNPQTLKPDPSMSEPVLMDAGEIGIEILSPQFARYGRKKRDGVMVGDRLTYDEVLESYGKEVAENVPYTNSGSTILDLTWLQGNVDTSQDARALIIRSFKPKSARYPKGLWWASTEDGRNVRSPKGLPGGLVPITPFRWIPVPGYWALGISPLYAVTHSNKAADEAKQKQQEWMQKVIPKVLFKSGGGVAIGDFDETPGQEVAGVYPGAEPEWMKPPSYPQELEQQRTQSIKEGMLAAGYEFTDRPDLLPGDPQRGARTRQPIRQKGGSEVETALLVTKPSWQRLGAVLLSFVGRFYTEKRAIAINGPDSTYQWIEFKGTDFSNLAASIHVDELPFFPRNRQSLRDSVVALLQTEAGQVFFRDKEGELDQDKLQIAAEAVGVDVALSTLDVDVVEARNEISMFRAGQNPEYKEFQDSETHLTEKLKTLKSLAFKGWDEQAQEALLQNVQQHREALQEQQQSEEEALTEQERKLRTIRAETEAMGDIRKALGEKLLDLVMETLSPPVPDKEKKT